MTYSIDTIKDILQGELLMSADTKQNLALAETKVAGIEHLLIDSRKISFPETSLFFAIVGERHDGHDFIADVYQSGVRCFVVSNAQNIDLPLFKDAFFVKIPHVLQGLQDLAAYHRSQFPQLKVIGITGSNGKTIVKEWLYQLLKDDFHIVRSPKSYNSQVGVPLSVWQINETHTLGVFEAGISTIGEMAALERIIQPTIGVFTNLGEAHSEGFKSEEEKIHEKFKLFKNAQTIICRQDEVNRNPEIKQQQHFLTWSKNEKADAQIVDIQYFKSKTVFKIILKNDTFNIDIPFTDAASIDNVTTCLLSVVVVKAFLLSEKHPPPVSLILPEQYKNNALEKLKHLNPVAMRLELKAGINGCLVVNDSYNLDLNSLQIALDFISQQSGQLKRTVILSDILQSGQDADILYKKVADVLLEKGISKVICIGHNISKIEKHISPQINRVYFDTTDDLLKHIKNSDYNHEIILLKGARPFAFERIAERLALKSHKTVLEINLNALTHNLAFFKSLLQAKGSQPKTGLMAMVKASAYGNGSEEVARLLEFHKVEYLAVAYSDEGIVLRQAGVRMPIMVMNPEEESFDALRRYHLEPEIYSLNILRQLIDFSQEAEDKIAYTIHLKLDTGMHRLGFEQSDIAELNSFLNANKHITIASVFTHLAASEAAEHDHFTAQQVQRFMGMYEQITEGVGYKPMRHVLNSSGITRHPQYRFEMVRLGIGLYGIDSNGAFQNQLQVVQTLKASISQIKNVPQSETIGYSRRGVLTRDSRIATISIGYADGLLRGVGNRQFSVYLRGQRAPIIGSVCMDMTMIDVTDIPQASEGDEVEIFGSHIPVQALASVLDTIPYQIFTGISERVKRVYFQE